MIKRGYYDNEQLWYETLYYKSQLHGISKVWYDNGQISYETLYRQGQKHGIRKSWYRDGQPSYKRYYLYNDQVTEEEYKKHELIKKLSGL